MLITIPNLHVYSSIGSYQVLSEAITVLNKKHTLIKIGGYDTHYPDITCINIGIDIIGIDRSTLDDYYNTIFNMLSESNRQGYDKRCNPIVDKYIKYDFSDFDN